MSATLRLSPLTMLEVLSATSPFGKLSAKSSLSVMSRSLIAGMFSPVRLSANNNQNSVHLQKDLRFIFACSFDHLPVQAEHLIHVMYGQGYKGVQGPAGPEVGC